MTTTRRALASLQQGVLAAERGRVAEGLAQIRSVCAAEPGNAEAHAQLGRWLSRLHRQAEANAAVERALAATPGDARTYDTIGVVLSRGGLHARAVECFERAVALDPADAGFQFNLASSLKFLGRFDEAERAYEACLAADPLHVRAHHGLAGLRTWTSERHHHDRLVNVLARAELPVDAELILRHAIAKELEDLGRFEEAFEQLAPGKRRKREAVGYRFAQDQALFDAVRGAFAQIPEPVRAGSSAPNDAAPIFVVGLPRTGTTLVERILSSHSQVASVGESQNFGVALKRATGTGTPRVLDVTTLEASTKVDLGAVGREYLARTRPGEGAPRFVDKLPLNFFYLGHIARALPDASLVVVRRHPLDTVAANYRQLFATAVRNYDYALDLGDTAACYVEFDRLMSHWRNVLPGRVHEVWYEDLVARQEQATRDLLAACGLDFEPGCLQFERNPSATATASAVQVRQPLYGSSVGRWRRLERQLAPARAIFEARGIAVD